MDEPESIYGLRTSCVFVGMSHSFDALTKVPVLVVDNTLLYVRPRTTLLFIRAVHICALWIFFVRDL